ncbi:predicted protein [Naegleria gruberi]|uniref:Predicted protein n=1 Tax=Naegleria gruberi TaxID=5762 RepID=D2VSC0_NAEGR|nr:uncharacterized protein NAEGRDRAFT_71886 [Naegleria gruberi]EFC40396.1 predicted protein [Naegleria gruberi]|eukprot:XP_002673140.1 predicted protein [Naegleria gruberi strain NEG-M]
MSIDSRKTESDESVLCSGWNERILQRLIWWNQKMESLWFSIGIYGLVLLIHIVVWFLVGIVEDNFYASNRFFMKTGSIFSVSGCYITNLPSIILTSLMFFYSAIDVLIVLISLRSDRDTFSIKVETILLAILRSLLTIVYFVCSQVFETQVLTHIIPYSYSVMIGGFVEIIVSVLIPVIRAILDDSVEGENLFESEIELVLNNDEMCKLLLEFSRRSYCPEGVLFYKDVQSFKRQVQSYYNYKEENELLKTNIVTRHRERITNSAKKIVGNYLSEGALNELNVPSLPTKRNDILAKLYASEKSSIDHCPPKNLFDQVICETLLTLTEVFTRLKQKSKKIQNFLKETYVAQSTISQI